MCTGASRGPAENWIHFRAALWVLLVLFILLLLEALLGALPLAAAWPSLAADWLLQDGSELLAWLQD